MKDQAEGEKYDLSLVLACYNEGEIFEQSVEEIIEVLNTTVYKYEIIFVDDFSRDNTRDLIDGAIAKYSNVRFRKIFHPKNLGRGATVTDGFHLARGDIAGYIDIGLEVHARSFGGHGYSHEWIGTQPIKEQEFEIRSSRELVQKISGSATEWVMCYPASSYSQSTISLLRAHGCVLGLKAEPGVVSDMERPYELLRLDTNDLPVRVDTIPNEARIEGRVERTI